MITAIIIIWLLCGAATVTLVVREFWDMFDLFDYFMCAYAVVLGPIALAGWLFAGLAEPPKGDA